MAMKIEHRTVKVRDLVADYTDNEEDGVSGYGGCLDIRPAYQREFVYKPAQQIAVVDTVLNGLPLNSMYWAAVEGGTGGAGDADAQTYEVLDGQQRTISICRYVNGDFAVDRRYFHSLTDDEKAAILDYELQVYVCSGSDSDKLAWFRRINIAGEKLTEQELRNAVYAGRWLNDAKKRFSRPGAPAASLAEGLVKGSPIRQELLELALEWVIEAERRDDGMRVHPAIEDYMSAHQHDQNALALWGRYSAVLEWAKAVFPVARKERVGRDWGRLYLEHQGEPLDPDALEARIKVLLADDEVTKKTGVYDYVLTGDARHLSLRSFTPKQKAEMFTRQGGKCANPSLSGHDPEQVFALEEMEGDHIDPWHSGGKTELDNGQMLCKPCNRRKSGM